jgi:16S rRNA (cytidine1402-2'-O)-methyltransferase
MAGTLFVVSTPIGNLEDITLRALRVLREADVVLAEDTRRTAGLMAHFDIRTTLESLHEHNEVGRLPAILERLARGDHVALVSDAGTPLVSDPGAELVRAALDARHRVEVLPGPSALLAALVASGLPAESFTFLGFVPPRAEERRRWLLAAGAEPRTIVFFEAPHRIVGTLTAAIELLGDREVAVGRELTKMHEEFLRGPLSRVVPQIGRPRGEYTVVLASAPLESRPAELTDRQAYAAFRELTSQASLSRREAMSILGRQYGLPARHVYAAVERGKRLVEDEGPPSG